MLTIQKIKETVEVVSGIADISIKSRKIKIIDARCVYFLLCRKFKKETGSPTLTHIAELVNLTHCMATYWINQTNMSNRLNGSEDGFIYKESLELLQVLKSDFEVKDIEDINILRIHYRKKTDEFQEKYRSVINSLVSKLNKHRKNQFINELASLSDEDLKELEEKFRVFLKVKQSLNHDRK